MGYHEFLTGNGHQAEKHTNLLWLITLLLLARDNSMLVRASKIGSIQIIQDKLLIVLVAPSLHLQNLFFPCNICSQIPKIRTGTYLVSGRTVEWGGVAYWPPHQ